MLLLVPVFAEPKTHGDARERYRATDQRQPRWNFVEPNEGDHNRHHWDDK